MDASLTNKKIFLLMGRRFAVPPRFASGKEASAGRLACRRPVTGTPGRPTWLSARLTPRPSSAALPALLLTLRSSLWPRPGVLFSSLPVWECFQYSIRLPVCQFVWTGEETGCGAGEIFSIALRKKFPVLTPKAAPVKINRILFNCLSERRSCHDCRRYSVAGGI